MPYIKLMYSFYKLKNYHKLIKLLEKIVLLYESL